MHPVKRTPAYSEAAPAAETFVMHRMTQRRSGRQFHSAGVSAHRNRWVHLAAMFAVCAASATSAGAAAPAVATAEYDFAASGYVAPAGMVPPDRFPGGVVPAGFYSAAAYSGGPGGMACDAGCDGTCGGGCAGSGGFLGSLSGGGHTGGLSSLRHLCLFCRGSRCGVCQTRWRFDPETFLGRFLPYTDAGICAQRWYDLSVEGLFLGHNRVGSSGTVTTIGTGLGGDPVLGLANVGSADLEGGVRASAAFIFGAGGNLEVTYMGGQEWDSLASVSDPGGNLFSFISEFGTDPTGGFADTDNSIRQSLETSSEFHSGEFNYRRRTVGPYCRFQGSWLIGLRYLRYDDGLVYSTIGNSDFVISDDQAENNLFGGQIGGDFWWNVASGVNLGCGVKGGWYNNEVQRQTSLSGTSIGSGGPGSMAVDSEENEDTFAAEFDATLIYRLSHSWSLRTSYYAIAIDEVAFGTADSNTISNFVQLNPVPAPETQYDTIVIQGVGFGGEYIW